MPDLTCQDYMDLIRQAKFPEGKSVDVPTYLRDHGNPEAAEEWEAMNKEHGDKFKTKSASVKSEALRAVMELEQDSEQVAGLLYNLLLQWQYGPDDVSEDFGRLTHSLHGGLLPTPPRSVLQKALGAVSTPASVAEFLSVALNAVGEKQLAAKSRELIRTASDESDTDAKFEKGKPADPCKNMSEAECAEWKKQNEAHKDQFKNAADAEQEAEADEDQAQADEEKAEAKRDEANAERAKEGTVHRRQRLTWTASEETLTKTTREAASGLYGHTKATQRDVEASVRKIQRRSAKIAKVLWQRDERVASFMAAHAKRAQSEPAKLLVASLKAMAPKVASTSRGALDSDQEILYDALMLIAENDGAAYRAKDPRKAVERAFVDYRESQIDNLDYDFKTVQKVLVKDLAKAWRASNRSASEKEAGFGLYGYRAKTAQLGLNACTEVRAYAGQVAYDLHSRRATRHEIITGFLKEHSKRAQCGYSRLLLSSYPDPTTRVASQPEACETPVSVAGWLSWEG